MDEFAGLFYSPPKKVEKPKGAPRKDDRLYATWHDMKQRCFNPHNRFYEHYGGKGITVCDDWLDYEKFKEWADSSGYGDELTIDRIDSSVGYEPDNCRWITRGENCARVRETLYLIDGKEFIGTKAAMEYFGCSWTTIKRKMKVEVIRRGVDSS